MREITNSGTSDQESKRVPSDGVVHISLRWTSKLWAGQVQRRQSQSHSEMVLVDMANALLSGDSGYVEFRAKTSAGRIRSLFVHLPILCSQSSYFKTSSFLPSNDMS